MGKKVSCVESMVNVTLFKGFPKMCNKNSVLSIIISWVAQLKQNCKVIIIEQILKISQIKHNNCIPFTTSCFSLFVFNYIFPQNRNSE